MMRLMDETAAMNAEAVIPSTRSREVPIPHDETIYKLRNRIERCFSKLKHFRRFATRYDRRADYFLAFVHLAAQRFQKACPCVQINSLGRSNVCMQVASRLHDCGVPRHVVSSV